MSMPSSDDATNAKNVKNANNDSSPSEHEAEARPGGGPPAKEDGPLDSIGKAITAPMRDDPGTNVDEKPEDPPVKPAA